MKAPGDWSVRINPLIEAVYGCIALLAAMIMALAACYAVSLSFGDLVMPALAVMLTGYVIFCARKIEGGVLPNIVSMTLTFAVTAILVAFSWKIRLILFDLDTVFAYGMSWNSIILCLLMPLAVIAAIAPSVFRARPHGEGLLG